MGIEPYCNGTIQTRTHILGRTEPNYNWTASNRRGTRTEPVVRKNRNQTKTLL